MLFSLVVLAVASPPFNSEWFRSDAEKIQLDVVNDSTKGEVLRWTKPSKPSVILTYFAESQSLANVGDVATIKFGWRSDGVNKCDPFDYSDGKSCACSQKIKETCEPGKGTPHCAKISVNCLEGTGDFRLALMETKALKRDSSSGSNSNNSSSSGGGSKSPVADNFCPTTDGDGLHACIDQIGADYHAYQFRFMPHVGRTYVHPKDSEAGGFFSKQNSTDPFDYHRLPGHWNNSTAASGTSGVYPGFGAPNGAWVDVELSVTRAAAATYSLSIRMGEVSYNYTNTWNATYAGDMPQAIDALGIWFPNSRDYSYVELAAATAIAAEAV